MLATDDKCLHYAVVQTATNSLSWETLEEEFITKFTVSDKDESLCLVPATAIVHLLLVFDDFMGDRDNFFVSLPRRS